MTKECSNCGNQTICKLNWGVWELWRNILQGRISQKNDPMGELLGVISKRCGHWSAMKGESE